MSGGAALGRGDVAVGGPALDALVRRKLPLRAHLGYRFDPRVRLGLFLELARADAARASCADGCDGRAVRFGADLELHLAPRARLDPWIGLGVGFEFLEVDARVDADGDGTPEAVGERALAGVEAPVLEAGVDLALSRFRIGPFVGIAPGQYTSAELDAPGAPGPRVRIAERAWHAWAVAGVRVGVEL